MNDQVALPDHYSGGASFADYDNDGWPDLLVLGREADVLFHNEQGKGFKDVTEVAGVSDDYVSKTASWGDYDNDGWLDLYVANWSCLPRCTRSSGVTGQPDSLYHNNGDGTFDNVTDLLGSETYGGGFVARWLDYDNDGDLTSTWSTTSLSCRQATSCSATTAQAVQAGALRRSRKQAGADTKVMGMGVAADDWDRDGDSDLYFTNAGPMVLLENQGDGTFRNRADGPAWPSTPSRWLGARFRWTLTITALVILYVATMKRALAGASNPLFQNDGTGKFAEIGYTSGAGDPGPSVGVATADYDNDGWVDLVVGNYDRGYHLFHNAGLAKTITG